MYLLLNYVGLAILHDFRRAFGAFRPRLFAERLPAFAVCFTVNIIVARLSHLALSSIALHIQYEQFAAVARGSNFAITCR